MNAKLNSHSARLLAPYFSAGEGAELHRYFEPEFIPRFQKELQRHLISPDSQQQWKAGDRFSRHDQRLVLRLPMHKSFYLVSCEVVCDRPGYPALDPQKITSAGFVIRRLAKSGEQAWMLEEDEALGWQPVPTGLRDPDLSRRRRCPRTGRRIQPPADMIASYTGEQTHPLHPVKSYDSKGKCHTILYGYLPLGGSYVRRETNGRDMFDGQSLDDFKRIVGELLPWPYGYRDAGNKHWRDEHARPITNGRPTRAFFELLRTLVNRYHLGEPHTGENTPLETLASGIHFYQNINLPGLNPGNFNDLTRTGFLAARRYSLLSWLQRQFAHPDNPLVAWMAEQEKRLDAAPPGNFTFDRLPPRTGNGSLNLDLYMTPGEAQELREELGQRALSHVQTNAREIPMPKFRQEANDVYQIVPFVRMRNDAGCEQIIWGNSKTRSEVFRVAAPFDPHASRPSLIQMPSLRDLKSGLAKGASMLTPPDTFGLLNSLKLKKGASEEVLPDPDDSNGGGIGIQWICSFSLPVITLVAMILLMIMISLLNIIFFWLPWVRICLPFPKAKDD